MTHLTSGGARGGARSAQRHNPPTSRRRGTTKAKDHDDQESQGRSGGIVRHPNNDRAAHRKADHPGARYHPDAHASLQRQGIYGTPRFVTHMARLESGVMCIRRRLRALRLLAKARGVAAEAWRRDQARALINDIVVVHQESASAYPVFMHVPAIEDSPPAYHKRDTVLTNADMRKASIAEALGQLESIMRRYDTLNALAGVRREIVKARQKLTTSKRAKRVV